MLQILQIRFHTSVVNLLKPGWVRIAFDASAKYNKRSLNQNLFPGQFAQ